MSLLDDLWSGRWVPIWLRRRVIAWLGYRVLLDAPLPGGSLRVLERGTVRRLRFGDAWEDQSAFDRAAPTHPLLPYTQLAALGLALPPRLDGVLHLGLGGGTLARMVHVAAPDTLQHAVERYAEVADAARRYFDLPDSVSITIGDAAGLLDRLAPAYDLVFLDAFAPSGAPVSQSAATFVGVRRVLRPDGWLIVNATDDVRTTVLALHDVFASVAWIKIPDADQYLLVASDALALDGVRARAAALGARLGQELEPLVDRLVWADGSVLAGPGGTGG
ncbi:MAG: MnmC family methyltransferase [Pseudomonadota bacterium]|nr:MnmC family methyltransferase [Pseudomonadota bacterium]